MSSLLKDSTVEENDPNVEDPHFAYVRRNVIRMVGIPDLLSSISYKKNIIANAFLEDLIEPMLDYELTDSAKSRLNGYKAKIEEYLTLVSERRYADAKRYAKNWLNEFNG